MSDLAAKWGKTVAARGFTQVPNYLLMLNQFLPEEDRIPPSEMMVLLTLVGAWWKLNEPPYPSIKSIAERSNISERQALRALSSLEKKGLIKREKKGTARGVVSRNVYSLLPLAEKLKNVAIAFPNIYPRRSAEPVSSQAALRNDNASLQMAEPERQISWTYLDLPSSNPALPNLASSGLDTWKSFAATNISVVPESTQPLIPAKEEGKSKKKL